ncbi:MBOAT family O-acyltransferase [Clostridium frigidicarnis]|uniref:Alginate O-acetyltransferase complex protein AlgI n=1 Tax=Clostridium frigidicarnis TaxID=84698 RepID=A0A1I0XHD5_9CLOT|nr:MBOAT family O-acyltransferase [Clostridium frigidicarnis]SFB00097.1 alginate O-acetyltransferase complex protein AlgI [Clostridium frigidicarnis]
MVFSSLIFIFIFLPITLAIYYISPRKFRNFVLLCASLVFYGWGEPVYIVIMVFSTIFDYMNGLFISKYRKNKPICNAIFLNSVVINLGILFFFKYYGFLIDNINSILGLNINFHSLPLPVGISFYTFQTLSYVIDVYLGKVKAQKNIISFGAYVTMFPQLVAGPIVRYSDVNKELDNRKETFDNFGCGVERFITGLGKKVLLANNIGLLWTSIKASNISEISVFTSWIGILAFTFQIYFDFSGYSDMAIGLGKMFGFNFIENFNYPYVSKSITEFWRRWHISLGSWFREYVYIPLGGNRNGLRNQCRNLLVVWFLTGLWHGASWNFIFWGLYFGFFILIEKLFLLKYLEKNKVVAHIYTMILVILGWVFFDLDTLTNAFTYIKTMFGLNGAKFIDSASIYYLKNNIFLFIILGITSTPIISNIIEKLKEDMNGKVMNMLILANIFIMLISIAFLVNESYNPFLYFRF